MTARSWIQDDVSRHFGGCPQCRNIDAESIRISQPQELRRSVPAETLAKMCSYGRELYRSYLSWLAEP